MNLKPLHDKILVEPYTPIKITKSGILLVRLNENIPDKGKVIAIGDKVKEVKVGDEIIFHKLGYLKKINDGKELLIINEKAVYGILE